ncbi:MAG: AAA family ATPase [Synergistaceae bacterium]|nr:AAA family ATPase [Synergistaceae bacterium]
MKILSIHFSNLNSLRGEWHIDFNDKAYTSDGIFAVTGPTGAGKTTIFDAVCLALYGRTPRLSTRQKDEIMSKHTDECRAKVDFEAGGKNYTCEWSMTRTAGKIETAHTIKLNGRPLTDSSKQRDTVLMVESVTGLNFAQFTQSVLLAQGSFDSFLKGNATDRSKILELLTGTEIYSKISTSIANHAKTAGNELNAAKSRLADMIPRDTFGTDEEISREISDVRGRLSALEGEQSRLQEAVLWLSRVGNLKSQLTAIRSDIEAQRSLNEKFSPERARLDAGLRAGEIRHIHTELAGKRDQRNKLKERRDNLQAKIEDDASRLSQIESAELPEAEERFRKITAGIPEGETPDTIRTKIRQQIKASEDTYKQKAELEKQRTQLEGELTRADSLLSSAQKEYDNAQDRVSRLLDMRVSAVLDGERLKLKPGDICPLCGGVVDAEGLHRVKGENSGGDFRFDEELRTARTNENTARKKLQDAQNMKNDCSMKLDACRKGIADCEERRLEIRSAVVEMIEPLGIVGAKTCGEITSRIDSWQAETVRLSEAVTTLKNEARGIASRTEAMRKSLDEENSALESAETDLQETEEAFIRELEVKGFADEKSFADSLLAPGVIAELQERARRYDNETARLQALADNIAAQLADEEAKAVTDMTLDEANMKLGEKKRESANLHGRLGGLETAQAARKKLASDAEILRAEVSRLQKKYDDWSAFDKELGSVGGGKFGSFAQTITLRMLVQLANVQLAKISGRYTLIQTRDENKTLGLSVIDHDQANEIRPTDNLSGGERFIISLALALGLSQISGSKAQVDSLFIDEGFGSLDDDALSSALEALGEIRRDGRMIGIISHISGISERIPTKINVIPKSEGTSIITGPGCSGSR